MWIAPRDDATPAGATTTDAKIGIIKPQSIAGQAVDVGRLNRRMPIASDVLLRNIIRDKENEIGPIIGLNRTDHSSKAGDGDEEKH